MKAMIIGMTIRMQNNPDKEETLEDKDISIKTPDN